MAGPVGDEGYGLPVRRKYGIGFLADGSEQFFRRQRVLLASPLQRNAPDIGIEVLQRVGQAAAVGGNSDLIGGAFQGKRRKFAMALHRDLPQFAGTLRTASVDNRPAI